ncbi:MAG: glycine cleavage system protein H [Candidatus Nezhaarchaeota archaeon]|nr:glycine cleavage system protein H [Candidatus Nezhaarchaeota archaeon]MCX8141575.1 glycine cleavage system protein H [Candidatus Nezhaarchaeota archaeon]MDW8049842.1 biotin/lipoyl-containing protein [Nitrososphaerota archaeon]
MVKVGEFELPDELYYWRKGLTWAKLEPDGRIRVGLTDLGQRIAGKILTVRIRAKGAKVMQGRPIATIETAKWVGPLESPISGIIDEVNEELKSNPALLNEDPYGKGWIAILKPLNVDEELKSLVKGGTPEAIEWYKAEIKSRVK